MRSVEVAAARAERHAPTPYRAVAVHINELTPPFTMMGGHATLSFTIPPSRRCAPEQASREVFAAMKLMRVTAIDRDMKKVVDR